MGIDLLHKLSSSTDPAWEFMYTPKLAVTVGHFVSSCACFLFFWPKIGRYLMSLGCPYYSRSNLNSSVNFKSYLVIGNLTMIKTNCYNVSQTQRPIDDRFEFCKKRKY